MRLIDADELVEKLGEEYRRKGAKQVKDNFMNYIYEAPTVDAKHVTRWLKIWGGAKMDLQEEQ